MDCNLIASGLYCHFYRWSYYWCEIELQFHRGWHLLSVAVMMALVIFLFAVVVDFAECFRLIEELEERIRMGVKWMDLMVMMGS